MKFNSVAAGVLSIAFLTGGLAGCAGGPSRSAEQTVSDAALTAKVKAVLIDTPGVNALSINVDTYGGVVQLRGSVPSTDQVMRAVEATRRVAGVRQVENRLEVRS